MRLQNLGYAITGHRAQGVTVDTAHTVVTATTTRENFYVAMTRGRHGNYAYVATDTADDAHVAPHPSDNPDATARSVLYGVLQHVGAELSAHETITAEHERWGVHRPVGGGVRDHRPSRPARPLGTTAHRFGPG